MRLHRFYIKEGIKGETFDITDRDMIHQWKKVFRYNVGSQVILFDGSGVDYLCIISSIRAMGVTVGVMKKHTLTDLNKRKNIWLCVGLIKKDNFEWIVQKATELGVSHIVPILCEHSEKRKVNMDRLEKIAIEATEQSGRGDLPVILEDTTIENLFESGHLPQEKIAFHPEGLSFGQYRQGTSALSFAVFIGPEGGFSDKEISLLKSYNTPILSLGTQILRAETAAIAVTSLLLLD